MFSLLLLLLAESLLIFEEDSNPLLSWDEGINEICADVSLCVWLWTLDCCLTSLLLLLQINEYADTVQQNYNELLSAKAA